MRKKTNEEYIKEVEEKNPNVEVVGEYIDSKTKIDYRCKKCGDIFSSFPSNILKGHGCKKCSVIENSQKRMMTLEEYKMKVAQNHPNVQVLGDYINSKTKIEHQCKKCGHIWNAVPASIISGRGCPVCAIKSAAEKKTKKHDEYIREISQIHPNVQVLGQYIDAKTKILHKCLIDGYEWFSAPANMLKTKGCPVCTGKAVLQGYNDLMTTHPHIALEWDFEKNDKLSPTMVSYGCNKKAYWKCPMCGHSYLSQICKRTSGRNCPMCAKENKISNAELRVYYYIKKYFSDTISSYKNEDKGLSEIDVFIPSLHVGIEYDGGLYHQDVERDKKKDEICDSLGIKLIRIREPECPQYQSNCICIDLQNHSANDLMRVIEYVLQELKIKNPVVNFNNDMADINNLVIRKHKDASLAMKFPKIAAEWHPTKNGSLKPNNVSYGSKMRIWWLCSQCGHEWITTVTDRTRAKGSGCPECGKEKAAKSKCKPVYCLELNQIFEGAIEADRELGIDRQAIYDCLSGNTGAAGRHPTTNEKLHWYYVYDQRRKNGVTIKGAINLGLITEEQIDNLKTS